MPSGHELYDVREAHTNKAARVATGRFVERWTQLTAAGLVLFPAGVLSTE